MKKRITLALLAVLFVMTLFAFTACGGDETPAPAPAPQNTPGTTDTGSGTTDTDGGTSTDTGVVTPGTDTDTGSTSTDTSTDTGVGTDTSTDTSTNTPDDPPVDPGTCEHEYEVVFTKTPTCRDNGKTAEVCKLCGTQRPNSDSIVLAGKEYCTFEEVIIEADCRTEQNKVKYYACSICGDKDESRPEETIAPYTHEWEDTIIKAPTCDEAGQKINACKICSAPNGSIVSIPALEHAWGEPVETPAACGVNKKVTKTCTNPDCDAVETVEEEGTALEHDYEVVTEDPTCELPGKKITTCKRGCGFNKVEPSGVPAKGHIYENYQVTVQPTCVTEGKEVASCINGCGTTDEKAVAKLTTHYGDGSQKASIESKEASCHANSYVIYECTVEGCSFTEKVEGNDKMPHEFVVLQVHEPKCNAEGYTEYICKNCSLDDVTTCPDGCYNIDNFVPTTPHKKSENLGVTDSTCMALAYTTYRCEDCQGTWNEEIPANVTPLKEHGGWTYIAGGDVAPTCSEEGYSKYKCTLDDSCVEIKRDDYVRRADHNFDVYADGRLICKDCNVTYRDISTYNSTPIAGTGIGEGGSLVVEGFEFTWELIGYTKPKDAEKVVGGTDFVKDSFNGLSMNYGLIKLVGSAEAEYTIVIEDSEGATVEEVVKGTEVFFDLYKNGDVAKITIRSATDAEVRFYSQEA